MSAAGDASSSAARPGGPHSPASPSVAGAVTAPAGTTPVASTTTRHAQPAEQLRYAAWLEWGTRAGLAVLVVSFAAYVFGLLPSLVPPQDLAQVWGLPVTQYLQRTGAPTGWGWVSNLGRGDAAALLGIVILAGCSVPALLALVPSSWRKGDKAFAAMCVAEVIIVVLAATGWLTSGH